MAWTADDLLADVRRSGVIPTAVASALADTDILLQADKETQARLYPFLIGLREDWYTHETDYPAVAGQQRYRLPRRNLAGRVRDVLWFPQGTTGSAPYQSLPRIDPDKAWQWSNAGASGVPAAWYLDGAHVVLVPAPASTAAVLRVRWYTRPGRLTLATNARQITAVTPSGGLYQIQYAAFIDWDSTSQTPDIIKGSQPFEYLGLDLAVSSGGSSTQCTFSQSAILAGTAPEVGDWVSLPDTSPVVQLPVEAHGLLVQRTVARMLRQQGFFSEARDADADANGMEADLLRLFASRVEGEPRRLVGGAFFRRRSPQRWW